MHLQLSFSQVEYANKRKLTRRDGFLAEMEQVVPWDELLEVLRPTTTTTTRSTDVAEAARQCRLSACCASNSCSSG